ncbi:MAG: arylsulfatase [Planctomycetota bacterium]|jgi:arylsulfatase A
MKQCARIGSLAAIHLFGVWVLAQEQVPGEGRSPNVLLIITDDQGWGDVRSHGNPQIDTPALDRLASQGARLDRFYVSPVCAPTRASLLTGRHYLRTGTTWVTHRWEVLRAEEITIAEVLKQAGYATGCFGKWHNGAQLPNHPNGQGFGEFLGFCGGAWNLYVDAPLEHNGRPIRSRGYITDVLTDAALAFIQEHRDGPFFCYLPYNAPHSPFVVPDRFFDKYKARGLDDQIAAVYGMVESIDENVGRLLEKLDAWDLARDTIVLFLTDNGPNGRRFNGGMKGTKGSVHEGGVRVPLFVRWPGRIEAGTTVGQIAAHVDLLPTIVDLSGVPMPNTLPLDGVSLAPLLEGTAGDWPDRMLFSFNARRGEVGTSPGAVRTQRYRLVYYGKQYELYDMSADPGQEHDLARQRPEVVRRLREAYEAWLADVSRGGFRRPPIPIGYPGADRVPLPASAASISGGVRFANSIGWTTDWLTDWKGLDDRISWELDAARPGRYEVVLHYSCPAADVGSRIRLEAGAEGIEATILQPYDTGLIRRPDRVPDANWLLREFTPLVLGTIDLPEGRSRLSLQALAILGEMVCHLEKLELRRLESSTPEPEVD